MYAIRSYYDIAPTFEHHYVSSQAPDEEIDGTVEDLLKAEMAEEERRRATAQNTNQDTNIVKRRRKIVAPPARITSYNVCYTKLLRPVPGTHGRPKDCKGTPHA